MKIYELAPLESGAEFFASKREAIARAEDYGEPDMYINEHDIGRLTKDVACRLATGAKWSISSREIWRSPTTPEGEPR